MWRSVRGGCVEGRSVRVGCVGEGEGCVCGGVRGGCVEECEGWVCEGEDVVYV